LVIFYFERDYNNTHSLKVAQKKKKKTWPVRASRRAMKLTYRQKEVLSNRNLSKRTHKIFKNLALQLIIFKSGVST